VYVLDPSGRQLVGGAGALTLRVSVPVRGSYLVVVRSRTGAGTWRP
jgi:hypothetical protein